MKKRIGYIVLFGLTILVIGGCGQKENTTGAANGADSAEISSDSGEAAGNVPETVYEEPPVIELHPVSEDGESLLIKPCGYSWNWPVDAEQMAAAIADGPAPTSEGTHWDTLMFPENREGASEYILTMEVIPDELGINVWELTDIGNNDDEGDRIAVYQKAEIAPENFAISLRAGKIYQIYMVWDKENVSENGCFGAAYYVFMTEWPVQADDENTADGLNGTVEGQTEFPEATFGEVYTGEISSIDGVMMTVADVTPEGVSLEISNQSDKEITFGDDYELQVWQDGSWYRVDYIIDNWAFNAIGYETGPEGAKDSPLCLDVKWSYFHGILPEGHYRITKTANAQENNKLVVYCLA
ncbi:MAG: hypothetical protein K2H40_09695, partial [Lachnospiraceae bacterium]|nr:hypothetical protein [Lachnospiraceae bacterium]